MATTNPTNSHDTFYTPDQKRHMKAYEHWATKNLGGVDDYAYIDGTAPTKHIRHEARAFFGDNITISDEDARLIWSDIAGARHQTLKNSVFIPANTFMTHVAVIVEI